MNLVLFPQSNLLDTPVNAVANLAMHEWEYFVRLDVVVGWFTESLNDQIIIVITVLTSCRDYVYLVVVRSS